MELVIPGRGSAASGPATVSGVQFDGQAAVQVAVETLPYEDRRAMLLGQPFTPGAPPELDLASRTIFFPPPDSGPIAPVVITQRPEEIPAVPEGVFRAAGWIVPLSEGTAHLGEITGLASPGTTPTTSVSLIPGAEVVLRFFGEGVPRVGEEFVTYSLGHEIPGYGRVAVPTGLLSVVRVDGSVAVAKVVGGLSRMRVGHWVTVPRTFPLSPGVHPAPTGLDVRARLVGLQGTEGLSVTGDFAFIDGGASAGFAVGGEVMGRSVTEVDGMAGEVARVQGVGVADTRATVRLLSVESPGAVRPGLRLWMDAKMP
jgi:hypothetical protein